MRVCSKRYGTATSAKSAFRGPSLLQAVLPGQTRRIPAERLRRYCQPARGRRNVSRARHAATWHGRYSTICRMLPRPSYATAPAAEALNSHWTPRRCSIASCVRSTTRVAASLSPTFALLDSTAGARATAAAEARSIEECRGWKGVQLVVFAVELVLPAVPTMHYKCQRILMALHLPQRPRDYHVWQSPAGSHSLGMLS